MPKADCVLSTPPTNTPIDTTRRGFLGGTAAALAAGTAVNVAALATMRPAAAASDPILAAIEAHKAAWAAADETQRRYSEEELFRLQYERRTSDEYRRGKALEAARDAAFNREGAAAIALLGVTVTTLPGVLALLQHVRAYEDATYCEGWPTHMVMDEEAEGTRPWHYYLVENLIRDLPAIMGGDLMAEHLMDNALELYCHGVEPIEKLGPMRRLIFTTPDTQYPGHRNVVVKLIVTAELLAMLSCLAANDPRGVSPKLLALETNIAN